MGLLDSEREVFIGMLLGGVVYWSLAELYAWLRWRKATLKEMIRYEELRFCWRIGWYTLSSILGITPGGIVGPLVCIICHRINNFRKPLLQKELNKFLKREMEDGIIGMNWKEGREALRRDEEWDRKIQEWRDKRREKKGKRGG